MEKQSNISILKVIFLIILPIIFSTAAYAQNLSGPTSVGEYTTETYIYNDGISYTYDGWDIVGGTLISNSGSGTVYTAEVQWGPAGAGSVSFKKKTTILETLNVTISQPATVITELNYIHNITPRTATTDITTLSNNNKIESITYFDGLGRSRQSIGIRAGGNSEDIITHIEYDEFGRMVKEYLPYSSATDIGTYRVGALDATNAYYDASTYEDDFPSMTVADINPYSEKEFDNSPLNRVMKQAAPGKDWKLGNGHEIEMEYLTNTSADEVRHYSVTLTRATPNNAVIYTPTLVDNNYYPVNELYKTVTRDENHDGSLTKDHTTEEFKNKQGQVVLKRTYENEVAHDTYYVYDDYGNLSFVLSPKSEAHDAKPDATELSELCYQYKYDDRNRLVEKKIPGKGWEYIVYNKLDQPIMTQDTEMKNDGKWLVTKYDIFGRVAYTAIKNTTATRTYLQGTFDSDPSTVPQYESKVTSGTGYLGTYYTSNARPTALDEILTINYYDNYNFDLSGGTSETAYGVTPIANVKGLATGSKVKVLGTSDWITTVTYYDEKARPIYVFSRNDYLNVTDKIKSDIGFDGRIIETTSDHHRDLYSNITVRDRYSYDHTNRLTKHTQKINNAALDEVIASNTYDDLGQLTKKYVGGKTNLFAGLQQVDYDYNVRGWLKGINNVSNLGNDDLFAFKIKYTDPELSSGVGLYNGNISETQWKTKSDNTLFRYTYHYDALNRIKKADFSGGGYWARYLLDNVTYDKNGNIMALQRNGHVVAQPDRGTSSDFGVMDNLTYTYDTSSNRLKKVDDAASFTYGFKDGATLATEYTYDDNGNMISDANKDITLISYNHLNLPTNVNFVSGDISYIYDATGVKQKKIVTTSGSFGSTTNTEYAGNFIYKDGTLEMFSHPEGYVEQLSAGKVPTFGYAYQYKDHLGNIRLTYADSDGNGEINSSTEIIEENNYYPFGLKHKGYNDVVSANVNGVASKLKQFQGQEFTDDLGLNVYEWKYRISDPAIGRFWQIDPLAEKYNWMTTYQFSSNQPIHAPELEGLENSDDLNKKMLKRVPNILFDANKKLSERGIRKRSSNKPIVTVGVGVKKSVSTSFGVPVVSSTNAELSSEGYLEVQLLSHGDAKVEGGVYAGGSGNVEIMNNKYGNEFAVIDAEVSYSTETNEIDSDIRVLEGENESEEDNGLESTIGGLGFYVTFHYTEMKNSLYDLYQWSLAAFSSAIEERNTVITLGGSPLPKSAVIQD